MGKVGKPMNGNEKRVTYGTSRLGTRGIRRRQYFESLSEEELRELSEQKASNGCATEEAMEVRAYLYNRRKLLGY